MTTAPAVPSPPPTEPAPPSAPSSTVVSSPAAPSVATCGDCAADLVSVGFPKAVGGTIGLGVVCSVHPTGNAPQATSLFDGRACDRAIMREYTAAALKPPHRRAPAPSSTTLGSASALVHSTALTLLAAWSQGDGTKADAGAVENAVIVAKQLIAATAVEPKE